MNVANVCGRTSVVSNRYELDADLFARVQAEVLEKVEEGGAEVLAMRLEKMQLFGQKGDVSKLYRTKKVSATCDSRSLGHNTAKGIGSNPTPRGNTQKGKPRP